LAAELLAATPRAPPRWPPEPRRNLLLDRPPPRPWGRRFFQYIARSRFIARRVVEAKEPWLAAVGANVVRFQYFLGCLRSVIRIDLPIREANVLVSDSRSDHVS
jgi:hypothetical protein